MQCLRAQYLIMAGGGLGGHGEFLVAEHLQVTIVIAKSAAEFEKVLLSLLIQTTIVMSRNLTKGRHFQHVC